ncbi:MAG: sigma-70 family RNA polymerase sigma factor [Anaerolineae bacterium]|nr:sigma-70 family RNA polymerase sigma factor [Chloroflexota bacterium]
MALLENDFQTEAEDQVEAVDVDEDLDEELEMEVVELEDDGEEPEPVRDLLEEQLLRKRTRVDIENIPADDTVSLYLKQMGQVALLTAEEEVLLAKRIEAGVAACKKLQSNRLNPAQREDLEETVRLGEQARTRLVEANTRLVVSVAKRYLGQGVPMLDLVQEGNIGLMKAVEKFDYHRGYKFSTYATWWIRQGITRALAQQSRLIRLPVHAGDQIRRIYRIIEQIEQEEGRRPVPEEIAEQTGLSVTKIERLMRISRYPVSLERPVGDDGDTEFGDFIEDDNAPAPADVTHRQLLREALEEVMTALSPREIRILELRFGLRDGKAHTLEEVGAKFDLTRERIRQIEHQALARLRHPYRCAQLRDYLR